MRRIDVKQLRELRERTGAGVTACRLALQASGGDMQRAIDQLRKNALAEAELRAGRETREGAVGFYLHHDERLGAMVEVNCETDFVANTPEFKELVRQLAEHIAAAAPQVASDEELDAEEIEQRCRELTEEVRRSGRPQRLLEQIVDGKMDAYYRDVVLVRQPWVREPKTTVGDLIKETSGRLREKLRVRRFARFQMERAPRRAPPAAIDRRR